MNVFVEQLPSLISTKNILWDVGIYSGIKIDEIEATKENNPYNINQAGREVTIFPYFCFRSIGSILWTNM